MRSRIYSTLMLSSVGITGILIIILSLDQLPVLAEGFVSVLIDHPTLAGFLPGIPLLNMISSKQKVQYVYSGYVLHSEFAAVVQIDEETLRLPFSGWLQKVDYSYSEAIKFDNPIVVVSTTKPGTMPDVGTSAELKATDIGSAMTTNTVPIAQHMDYRPSVAVIGRFSDEDSLTRETIHHMLEFEKNEALVTEIAIGDFETAPTTGALSIRYVFTFIIGSFNKVPRGKRKERHVNSFLFLSLGETQDTEVNVTYVPNASQRLFSVRATMFTMDDETKFFFGQKDPGAIAAHVGALTDDGFGTEMGLSNQEILLFNDTGQAIDTTGDGPGASIITQFVKGPIFMKKSEPWTIRFDTATANKVHAWMIAQVMVDYKASVDFSVQFDMTVSGESHSEEWRFPYDVYVDMIETEVRWEDANGTTVPTNGIIQLFMVKPGDYTMGSYVQGNILSIRGGASASGDGNVSPAEVDRLSIVGNNLAGSQTSLEMIGDYFPQGSHLVVAQSGLAEADSLVIHVKIEGHNPVKQGKKDALAEYFTGHHVIAMGQGIGVGSRGPSSV